MEVEVETVSDFDVEYVSVLLTECEDEPVINEVSDRVAVSVALPVTDVEFELLCDIDNNDNERLHVTLWLLVTVKEPEPVRLPEFVVDNDAEFDLLTS
jgi:hypothetical protein